MAATYCMCIFHAWSLILVFQQISFFFFFLSINEGRWLPRNSVDQDLLTSVLNFSERQSDDTYLCLVSVSGTVMWNDVDRAIWYKCGCYSLSLGVQKGQCSENGERMCGLANSSESLYYFQFIACKQSQHIKIPLFVKHQQFFHIVTGNIVFRARLLDSSISHGYNISFVPQTPVIRTTIISVFFL